jgi:hypothetical protein
MAKINWMTAQDLKESMKNGLSNMHDAFVTGVQNPRRIAAEAAIEKIKDGTWRRNFLASIDKWAINLGKVTLEQWKKFTNDAADFWQNQCTKYGAANWAAFERQALPGINAAGEKLAASAQTEADFKAYWAEVRKISEGVKI